MGRTPQEKKPKKEKSEKGKGGLVIRIVIILVVVAAVGGGVFLFLNRSPAAEAKTPEASPAPTETAQPSTPPYDPARWNLILVSAYQELPHDFTVDLVTLDGGEHRVDARVTKDLEDMLSDAAADGIVMNVCSAFRNVSKQTTLYQQELQRNRDKGMDEAQSIAEAGRYIQPPKFSEHHTGLAVDINMPDYPTLDAGFADTEAFRWLSAHAVQYGFILRYPDGKESVTGIVFEPWHYRYVGRIEAIKIEESGLCFEDYLASQAAAPAPASTASPAPTASPDSGGGGQP